MRKGTRIICAVAAVGCIFGAGIIVGRHTFPAGTLQALQKIDLSEVNTSYKFINPLLFCQDQNVDTKVAIDMENMVGDYITQEKKNGNLMDASFYFRDLNGGPWALVNKDFRTLPSSLLKVPVAISAYEYAAKHPDFLGTKVPYQTDTGTNTGEHFQPKEKVEVGHSYPVEDLIRYMIQDSDNEALFLLGSKIGDDDLKNSYTRLGVELPTSGDRAGYTMGVRTYASFFRVLYNGTYLTQDDSEHLLSLLSQSSFTQGLVAKLPRGIVVAHKFGEASSPDGTKRLNDCGIVYKPDQPYLICVMTKGRDLDALASVISDISANVYKTLQGQE